MIVFDGTYMLERKEDPGATPAHACAWRVKIIDLSLSDPSLIHIRSHIVLAVRKEGGIFKTTCAESLGKRICADFNLPVADVLWTESFPDLPGELYAAVFTPEYDSADMRYRVAWRPVLENERAAVAPWI